MPGVPKSPRCTNCRRRKVKCDLKVPTCTPCLRMKISCSGPQKLHKFVLNGDHTADAIVGNNNNNDDDSKDGLSSSVVQANADADKGASPWFSIDAIRSRRPEGGSTYGFFRLANSGPRRNPVSGVDRLVACLSAQLATKRFATTVSNLGYLSQLPRRLSESAVLRACVLLFCDAWAKYWRGLPISELIDPRLQSRALHSLQLELSGPRQAASETLAAITLLQRLEILFGPGDGKHRTLHSAGMLSLMAKRGPPKIDDSLDVHMALDNQATLLGHWVIRGGNSIFLDPEWKSAMRAASNAAVFEDELEAKLGSTFELDVIYWQWPTLVHGVKALHLARSQGIDRDSDAALLQDNIQRMLDNTIEVGEPFMVKARLVGGIRDVVDPDSLTGVAYDFHTTRFCEILSSYLFGRLVMLRMLADLRSFRGLPPNDAQDAEYKRLSRTTLMFIPYLQRTGPIARAQFAGPLSLGANGLEDAGEKDALLEFVMISTGFASWLPDRKEEAVAITGFIADAMSGRSSLVQSDSQPGQMDPPEECKPEESKSDIDKLRPDLLQRRFM